MTLLRLEKRHVEHKMRLLRTKVRPLRTKVALRETKVTLFHTKMTLFQSNVTLPSTKMTLFRLWTIAVRNLPTKVPALITYAEGIVKGLTGNPSVPTTTPPLTPVTRVIDDVQTAETAALSPTRRT